MEKNLDITNKIPQSLGSSLNRGSSAQNSYKTWFARATQGNARLQQSSKQHTCLFHCLFTYLIDLGIQASKRASITYYCYFLTVG